MKTITMDRAYVIDICDVLTSAHDELDNLMGDTDLDGDPNIVLCQEILGCVDALKKILKEQK